MHHRCVSSSSTAAPWRGRLRVRTVLVLGMVIPLLGVGGLAGVLIGERWSDRQASTALEDTAADLGRTVSFVAALGEEEVHATVLGLAADFGDDELADGVQAALDAARARVDAARPTAVPAALADDLVELDELRDRLDASAAGYVEVSRLFARLSRQLEIRWREQLSRIEQAGDRQPLTAEIRSHLRTLRESMEAFSHSDERIRGALGILGGVSSSTTAAGLVDATSRFESARERAMAATGAAADPTRARAAWQAFLTDPAAERTEATLAQAIQVGLGNEPAPAVDLDTLAAAFGDGARWALLLTDVVHAAADDLEEAAAREADLDTRAVVAQTSALVVLAMVSVGLVLATAREIARPARDLEEAARRVERGDFELTDIDARGPRELAATVQAFNDMAATLAAVEDHAVALAEDPDSPIHSHPLPGRTGRAMQAALDRLRQSITDAEDRRAELTELATRDGLTGLLNRTAALDAVGRDLARARRDGGVLLALYIDLDGLKAVNDTYGHAAGDEAIRAAAAALTATTRDGDVVARLGGDEFLIAGPLPPGGRPGVDAVAERILAAVRDTTVPVDDGDPVHLRCSIGVATSCPGIEDVDSLVRAADLALYQAKEAGRGRVVWFTPPECV